MIVIDIILDKTGLLRSCSALGHAGAGKTGSDIVCAAVSVLYCDYFGYWCCFVLVRKCHSFLNSMLRVQQLVIAIFSGFLITCGVYIASF
jgi:uncharacterized protein YsxB (DUF464 family)